MVYELMTMQQSMRELFNNAPDLISAIKKNIEDSNTTKKRLEEYMQERALHLRESLLRSAELIGDVKVVRHVGNDSADLYKSLVPYFKGTFTDVKFLFVGGSVSDGKPSLTVFISQPMVDAGYHAGNIVRDAAKYIQGGGGGQPFMATAGGKYADGLDEAVDRVIELIQ